MIKRLDEDTVLKLKTLDPEYKEKKGVLGRLYGQVASFSAPTRNGRKYTQDLWEKLFNSDLIKERFANGGIFGQLCHPDYEEVDMEKVAIVMPEQPVKDNKGQLMAYVDILDTPCGRIAYQLAKYGYKFGISSRGTGDLIDGPDGEEVDPDTYQLNAFDLVEIPAVESARLAFTEALDTKKLYNKTLKQRLTEEFENAEENDRAIMKEALDKMGIDLGDEEELEEEVTRAWLLRQDGTTIPQVVHTKLRSNSIEDVISHDDIQDEIKKYRELTNNEEVKTLIDKLFKHINNNSDDLDTMNYLYKLIFDNFNNEFCKVRVGGMYGDEGESEIYFRIASKDVNWYDAISKFMMSHKGIAGYISVLTDIEILHREDYKKLNGKEIKHMPVEEFIMAKGNPVVESRVVSRFEYNLLSGKPVVESYGKSNYIGHISNRFDSTKDITEEYNLNDIVTFKLNEGDEVVNDKALDAVKDDFAPPVDMIEAEEELEEKFYLRHEDIDKARDALLNKVDHEELLNALLAKNMKDQTIEDLCRQFGVEDKEFGYNIMTPDEMEAEFGTRDINDLVKDESISENYPSIANDEDAKLVYEDDEVVVFTYKGHKLSVHKDKGDQDYDIDRKIVQEIESISESCGDKEVVAESAEAGNAGDELLVNELQETLLRNKELTEDNLSLQEKLSVCNAKEVKLEEELARYKDATINLSKSAKEVKHLNEELENLNRSLEKKDNIIKVNKEKLHKLVKEAKEANDKAASLEEKLNNVDSDVKKLNEQLESVNDKYNASKLVIQKYQRELKESRDSFIQSKADAYGVKKEDVLSQLTESFKLNEVDSVCKKLSERNYAFRKLPFQLNENVSIDIKGSKNEYIKGNQNNDDYVSDELLRLVNLK